MLIFRRKCFLSIILTAPIFVGCAAPVVTIRHTLPSAVPIPEEISHIEVEIFSVEGAPKDEFGAFTAENLRQGMPKPWRQQQSMETSTETFSSPIAHIGGIIYIKINDTKGTREVRRWNPQTRQLFSHEVTTLIRKAIIEVHFIVTRSGDKEHLVTVETHRSYDSTRDPQVRGELGLELPDDPERVPAKEVIIRELLTECVESFCAMIAHPEVIEQVQMRPTLNKDGMAGLEAAKTGKFAAAIEHFEKAISASPKDVNLLFDLAVVAEAGGDLSKALQYYQAVVNRTKNQDQTAMEAARRVKRILLQSPDSHKSP